MGVGHVEGFHVFRLLVEFKQAAYRILREHPAAADDLRFRSQLQASASGAVSTFEEGYKRRGSGVFHLYLGYSSASLAEAARWLADGAERAYYPREECDEAFALSRRAAPGLEALQRSLRPYIKAEREARRAGRAPTYPPKKQPRTTSPPPPRAQPPTRKRQRRPDER
jgi:four helix bundle protein